MPKPTNAELAAWVDKRFDQIIYGVVVGGSDRANRSLFKVLHVYRGTSVVGRRIRVRRGWGFNPPRCWEMMPLSPLLKGKYGVIGWSGEPRDNFIDPPVLDALFAAGSIRRANPDGAQSAANRKRR